MQLQCTGIVICYLYLFPISMFIDSLLFLLLFPFPLSSLLSRTRTDFLPRETQSINMTTNTPSKNIVRNGIHVSFLIFLYHLFTPTLRIIVGIVNLSGSLQLRAENVPTPKRYQRLLTPYHHIRTIPLKLHILYQRNVFFFPLCQDVLRFRLQRVYLLLRDISRSINLERDLKCCKKRETKNKQNETQSKQKQNRKFSPLGKSSLPAPSLFQSSPTPSYSTCQRWSFVLQHNFNRNLNLFLQQTSKHSL